MATLHYIYDPLCGWCYCAEPLVKAARTVSGLELELHGGGLWPEPTRLPDHMRRYIRDADARAARISGQPYGAAYLDRLLADPSLTLDSRPTTAAILAAELLAAGKGLAMLQAIQHAHWEQGQHVVAPDVLCRLAVETGLDGNAFEQALLRVDADGHIASTRQMMQVFGVQGFPAYVLEHAGHRQPVSVQPFMGDPGAFTAWLTAQIA